MVLRKPLVFIDKLRSLERRELIFAIQAWALAPVMEGALAVLGVKRTLKGIQHVFPTGDGSGDHIPHTERARELVDSAYRRHLLKGECLPRSLIQYSLMRRGGKKVRFVMGVDTRTEFRAHAWVESSRVDGSQSNPETLDFEKLMVVEP